MKFTDEKTQELFEKCMEKYAEYYDKLDIIDGGEKRRDESDSADSAFISHVEARIRREGEECEWEKKNRKWMAHSENGPQFGCYHFCPMCGRSLEAK